MKIKITAIVSLCLFGIVLMIQQARTEEAPDEPEANQLQDQNSLEAQEEKIQETLDISPCLELVLENGVDPVMKAVQDGLIIDVTLEEVVAALDAAAATPDPEDDLIALEMKHRGSYRFFPSEDLEPSESAE